MLLVSRRWEGKEEQGRFPLISPIGHGQQCDGRLPTFHLEVCEKKSWLLRTNVG